MKKQSEKSDGEDVLSNGERCQFLAGSMLTFLFSSQLSRLSHVCVFLVGKNNKSLAPDFQAKAADDGVHQQSQVVLYFGGRLEREKISFSCFCPISHNLSRHEKRKKGRRGLPTHTEW